MEYTTEARSVSSDISVGKDNLDSSVMQDVV